MSILTRHDKPKLSYQMHHRSKSMICFLPGYGSNQSGNKAKYLSNYCKENNLGFTVFDYQGVGQSEGEFKQSSLNDWIEDSLSIISLIPKDHSIILIGSSMGAWIASYLSLYKRVEISGLITIAAAPDFTKELIIPQLNKRGKEQNNGIKEFNLKNNTGDPPLSVSEHFITTSLNACVLDYKWEIDYPIRLIHGDNDKDIPIRLSEKLMDCIIGSDKKLVTIKGGNHRLSTPKDLRIITKVISELITVRK